MIMRGCQSLVRVNLRRLVGDIQLHSPLRQNARRWSVRGAPIAAPRAENPIWKEQIHFHQSQQRINRLEGRENKNQQNNSHNMNLLKEFLDIGNGFILEKNLTINCWPIAGKNLAGNGSEVNMIKTHEKIKTRYSEDISRWGKSIERIKINLGWFLEEPFSNYKLISNEMLLLCKLKMQKSRKMFPLAFFIFNIFYWGGIMANLALRESYEAMETGSDHHDDFLDDDFFADE